MAATPDTCRYYKCEFCSGNSVRRIQTNVIKISLRLYVLRLLNIKVLLEVGTTFLD